ncbi:MAG: MBL fold metallo-hydrolase [Promethearchaeota archaeon]|nr:MAG: MBL fold metallo-hydrolase [Candidatus Lokiarchaeota archaeon]
MNKTIITQSGRVNEFIHLLDLKEFGIKNILSSYIGVFDNNCIIMDSGSSRDSPKIIEYLNQNQIPLHNVSYLLTTHHHFDHNGGMWKLYQKIKKHNPNVKILTNAKTKALLNEYEFHLARGMRTYGNLVGEMRRIPDKAFEIIGASTNFSKDPSNLDIIKTFKKNGEEVKLSVLKTPGHTPDHQSIVFIKNNEINFIFFGEAVGTLYHSNELITSPTSMPIFFDYDTYMDSLTNLMKLETPLRCGFGHHGVVEGKKNIKYLLEEHENFMKDFHIKVKKFYEENPTTKYVFKKIKPYFQKRYQINSHGKDIFDNIILGLVYGMMMSLGYRSPSDKEAKIIDRYKNQ